MKLDLTPKESLPQPGKIITFYSYKGGTGRSMALANVACLLAQGVTGNRGILVVDWDLEAPGLHKFFRDRLTKQFGADSEIDAKLDAHPGLIDLFCALNEKARSFEPGLEEPDNEIEQAMRAAANLDELIIETDIPSLHLLKAGRFDDEYPARINSFPWVELYDNHGWIFPLFADWLAERYQYVLIDSRTGDTDISNISSLIMPEKLVAVFTPNNQSLIGVLRILRRAFIYRKGSGDVRPLMVYPLPSRIDPEEPDRRHSWRYGSPQLRIPGYQPEFEKLFAEVYGLRECQLEKYFKEVQIQHTSRYAYGEDIATLIERSADRLSLSAAFEAFAKRLTSPLDPWEDEDEKLAETEVEVAINRAERVFAGLSPDDQQRAREVFTRLVRLPAPNEGGKPSALRISAEEFTAPAQKLLNTFAGARVLTKEIDSDTGKEMISLQNEGLLAHWQRLKSWLKEDQDFLLLRQEIRAAAANWVKSGSKFFSRLKGEQLDKAMESLAERKEDFSAIEQNFIQAGNKWDRANRIVKLSVIPILIFISIVVVQIRFQKYQPKRDLAQWGLPGDLYEYQRQLSSLSVSNNQITNTAWIAGNIKEVQLHSNGLRSLEALPQSITILDLSDNEQLTNLSGIEKLTNLTSLNFRSNKLLTNLSGIEKLTNLTSLNLSYTGLTNLASIEKLTNLTSLDLSSNIQLTNLSGIEKLTNLTSLNLSGNILLTNLSGIEKLTNLTSLNLGNNVLLTNLASIENLTNLTSLDLSYTGLTSLAGIEKLTNLTSLDLGGNILLTNLSGIEKLTNLTSLDLSGNRQLTSLAGIEKLTNLTSLDLSGNEQLMSLLSIEKLPKLTSLDLRYDIQLNNIEGIEKLTNLTSLDLSNNILLTNLSGIEKLTNLSWLDLSRTGLTSLAGIEKLTNLTSLDLSRTGLASLAGIERLNNLTSVNLGFTNLTNLTGIEELTNLTSLDLSHNDQLASLAGIEKLTNLTSLDLSYTGLTSLEGLEKCDKLITLDISGLRLTSLKGLPKSVEKLSL